MNQQLNRKLLVITAFSTMILFGLVLNLRGPVNPVIKAEYNLNHSQLALLMVFFSLGSSLASFSSGFLSELFSLKKVMWAGLALGSLGIIGINLIGNYYLLWMGMFLIGGGFGVLNLSGNSLASRIFTENKGQMMNLFHVFFGIGGLVASQYAKLVFEAGFSWERTYLFTIVLVVLLVLFSLLSKFPPGEVEAGGEKVSPQTLLQRPKVRLFVVMFFCHVGAEVGMGTWLGVYLDEVQSRTTEEISFYLFWFFAFFSIGRFLASWIVEKVGYLRLVLITSSCSLTAILAGLVGPHPFAFAFSLTGLFISINFPTMQAAMFEIFDQNISAIIGSTLMAGGLGNIVFGNWLAGVVNDWLGIHLGFSIFIIYLLILMGTTLYLKNNYLEREVVLGTD